MQFQGRHTSTSFAKKAQQRVSDILQGTFIYSLYANDTPVVDGEGLKQLIIESPPVVQFIWMKDFNYDVVYYGAGHWKDILCMNLAYFFKDQPEPGSKNEDIWAALIVVSVLHELGHWFIYKTGSEITEDSLNPGEIECGNCVEFDSLGGRIGTLSLSDEDQFQIEGLYIGYGDGVKRILSPNFIGLLLEGNISLLLAECTQMRVEGSAIPSNVRKNKGGFDLRIGKSQSLPKLLFNQRTWRDKRPLNTLTMKASLYPSVEDMESRFIRWIKRDIPLLTDDQKSQPEDAGLKQLRSNWNGQSMEVEIDLTTFQLTWKTV
ncbi:hypothetical protein MP638_002417 [Amoeboaphelidium occidentale]|nr:hypothetical protein MP638_002417 [Amoeboaphelidium occidentale]